MLLGPRRIHGTKGLILSRYWLSAVMAPVYQRTEEREGRDQRGAYRSQERVI
mgnify:CR=1 FL=1